MVTTGKILIDANPRHLSIAVAMQTVRSAGFARVRWRPFFVPQRIRLPTLALGFLAGAERVPGLRAIPLWRKFRVVVLGER